MRCLILSVFCLTVSCLGAPVRGEVVKIVGGQTNINLDLTALESFGINLVGVVGDVAAADDYLVAFPITPRDTATKPTTAFYDSADFQGTFEGTIEHTGLLMFTDADTDPLDVGDFSIGYDAGRAIGAASGFFVASTAETPDGLGGTLFDIEVPTTLEATADRLVIGANLLISPELSTLLAGNDSLAGGIIGDALVQGQVPEPSTAVLGLLGIGVGVFLLRRRA